MPYAPRVARATPRGPITRAADPIPIYVVLRWATKPAEAVPGHALAWTTGRGAAVLVAWLWDHHSDGGRREDWFAASDVFRQRPSEEELRALLARPSWMPDPVRGSRDLGSETGVSGRDGG